jgi:hypothetical protein
MIAFLLGGVAAGSISLGAAANCAIGRFSIAPTRAISRRKRSRSSGLVPAKPSRRPVSCYLAPSLIHAMPLVRHDCNGWPNVERNMPLDGESITLEKIGLGARSVPGFLAELQSRGAEAKLRTAAFAECGTARLFQGEPTVFWNGDREFPCESWPSQCHLRQARRYRDVR